MTPAGVTAYTAGLEQEREGEKRENQQQRILSGHKTLGLALHACCEEPPFPVCRAGDFPAALAWAQHLPTEAFGTTQPNPLRSHACGSVSPFRSYK